MYLPHTIRTAIPLMSTKYVSNYSHRTKIRLLDYKHGSDFAGNDISMEIGMKMSHQHA